MIGEAQGLELLSQAAAGRGAILSRRELRGFEAVSVSELCEHLRDLGHHGDRCQGKGSLKVFRGEVPADLGDAPAWIDAGAVYEDLVEFTKSRGPLDYVFCLDPWAAQLRSRAGEIASSAKWILVSDLEKRRQKDRTEYWDQLEEWFGTLSFGSIAPRESWGLDVARSEEPAVGEYQSRLYAQKLGAWQWRRITTSQPSASILFLVRYSGSLAHLRTLLDSLIRQEGDKESVQCVILAGAEGEDPRSYLKWLGLAHPKLRYSLLSTSGEWKTDLAQVLTAAPQAVLAMVGDHALLPPQFLGELRKSSGSAVLGIPLSVEASAHILTGNLDPLPNYETLTRSFCENQTPRNECARIFPPDVWGRGEGDPVSRLLRLTQSPADLQESSPLLLLELADLP